MGLGNNDIDSLNFYRIVNIHTLMVQIKIMSMSVYESIDLIA